MTTSIFANLAIVLVLTTLLFTLAICGCNDDIYFRQFGHHSSNDDIFYIDFSLAGRAGGGGGGPHGDRGHVRGQADLRDRPRRGQV